MCEGVRVCVRVCVSESASSYRSSWRSQHARRASVSLVARPALQVNKNVNKKNINKNDLLLFTQLVLHQVRPGLERLALPNNNDKMMM